MKKGKHLVALLLLSSTLLFGCAKSERDIAKDIAANDRIFSSCHLKLDGYEVIKRQTNESDKTDYIWLSVKGSNDNLEYSASYVAEYVKYNDGWRLENFICDNSSYTPKREPEAFEKTELLSNRYDSFSLHNTDDRSWDNQYTQHYHGTIVDRNMISTYLVTIDYEFSAINGWEVKNISESLQSTEFNLVGEWMYQDDTHLYYIHVSNVSNTDITMEYALLNRAPTPDEGLWSIRKADKKTYQFQLYHDDLLYTVTNPMVYLDVGWKKTYSVPRLDENGVIWFANTSDSFIVNGYQITRINAEDSIENYPEELRNSNDIFNNYSSIPSDLMDETLVGYLDYLKMTYKELGLNPNKSSGWQGQRYPLDRTQKVSFLGEDYSVFLYCVPEDDQLPYMLGITAYSHDFEDIKQYFLDSSCATLYQTDSESFTAVLNGTDVMLEVSYQSWNPTAHPEIHIKLIS